MGSQHDWTLTSHSINVGPMKASLVLSLGLAISTCGLSQELATTMAASTYVQPPAQPSIGQAVADGVMNVVADDFVFPETTEVPIMTSWSSDVASGHTAGEEKKACE